MADLSITVDGLRLPNPFIIGSGPPGTNANVIGKAFDEGWGAVIAKTISLDASKVVNVAPRYARMRVGKEIVGWENIELISDRPFETWLDEFKQLKAKYPGRILIASIMEEYHKDRWVEIVERCQDRAKGGGVDAFELNFSCPHGLPERKMGSAMGQDPEILGEVCGWVNSVATVPVWAKMTPNITHIEDPARAALRGGGGSSGGGSGGSGGSGGEGGSGGGREGGCEGISAINTILSVMGIDLKTLRPEPCVEGYTTPGGYSCRAIRPIALRMVMECARMMQKEFPPLPSQVAPASDRSPPEVAPVSDRCSSSVQPVSDRCSSSPSSSSSFSSSKSISAIGGIETGEDAAQFILLGASTVQVCTGVMIHGYGLIHQLTKGLSAFMDAHNFPTIPDFRGRSLPYFTTHADLVHRQTAAKGGGGGGAAEHAAADGGGGMVTRDAAWSGEKFVEQSQKLVANQ